MAMLATTTLLALLAAPVPVAQAAPAPRPAAPATRPAPAAPPAASAPAPGPAASPAEALARRVQAHYEATRDLEARFQQTYAYAGFGRKQTSSGTLKVKKPGKMRWDYERPAPKVVAVTGSRLVQYEPEDRQAYVDERFDASAMSAAVTFLLGQGELAREFHLSAEAPDVLVLRPKEPDPRVESIALTVGEGGQVTATRVVDGAGNVNEIRFEDVRRNAGIPDAAFTVALPPGTNLVAPPTGR
jgi:outer membrane lipoprotein carrier protein